MSDNGSNSPSGADEPSEPSQYVIISREVYDQLLERQSKLIESMRAFEVQLQAHLRLDHTLENEKFKASLCAEISDTVVKRLNDANRGTATTEKELRFERKHYSSYARISKIVERVLGDVANKKLKARTIERRLNIFKAVTYGDSSELSESSSESEFADSVPEGPKSDSGDDKDDSGGDTFMGFRLPSASLEVV